MIIIWLSWLLPLWPWYVFILSRWLYWHYHNESHHSAPPRLPRKRLFQQKQLSNFSISAIEKLYISFCHQNCPSLEKIHKLELLTMWSNETQVCAQQACTQKGANALILSITDNWFLISRELEWRFIINDLDEGTEYQQVGSHTSSLFKLKAGKTGSSIFTPFESLWLPWLTHPPLPFDTILVTRMPPVHPFPHKKHKKSPKISLPSLATPDSASG